MKRSLRLIEKLAIVVASLAVVAVAAIVAGPRFLPYQALIVRSGSMSPTIPTGSVVFYRREPASAVRVGQIILFQEPGRTDIWVTHRVHAVVHGASGSYFVTKGDANAVPDDWRVAATGEGWVAVFHVPDIGYALSYLGTGLGRLWLVTVPAFGLGVLLLLEVWQPRRSAKRGSGRHLRQGGGDLAAVGGAVVDGTLVDGAAGDGGSERRQAAWG